MGKTIKLGLVKGRHNIPDVTEYIYQGEIDDPSNIQKLWKTADDCIGDMSMDIDEIELYVIGLTPCLIEVLNVCKDYGIKVTLMHYNPKTQSYYPQAVKF